ncbi:hypothetical protein GCM10010214_37750 [Streptomyces abikoensis]|nr:hypothetical protein GCM10010214_37750 [Streptomyces abikoensis]
MRAGHRRLEQDAKPRDHRETAMTGIALNRLFGDRTWRAAPADSEGRCRGVTEVVSLPHLGAEWCYGPG